MIAEPGKKQRHLEIMGRWVKLSQKLLKKQDGRVSTQASANWAKLARRLLTREDKESERRLRAHRRLRNLAMKLVVLDAQKSRSRAHMNLAKLARLLV